MKKSLIALLGLSLLACGGPKAKWEEPENKGNLMVVCQSIAEHRDNQVLVKTGALVVDEKKFSRERIKLQNELMNHEDTQGMLESLPPEARLTKEQFAIDAFKETSDWRTSFDTLQEGISNLQNISSFLNEEAVGIYNKAFEHAKKVLLKSTDNPAVPEVTAKAVRLVCGSPVYSVGALENLYLDAGWLTREPLKDAVKSAKAVLEHAAWRSVFQNYVKPLWKVSYNSKNPALWLLNNMLEQGTGTLANLEQLDVTPEIEASEREVFNLLGKNYVAWRDTASLEQKMELWLSVERSPLFERWTSTPVGIALRRLSQVYSNETMASMLAEDSMSIFIAYDDACARFLTWPRLPPELVKDARRIYRGE